MLKQIRPAIVMIVVMTVITGLVYPLGMTGIAQVVFPYQANGSLIEQGRQGHRLGADRPELHRATNISTAGPRRRPSPIRRIRRRRSRCPMPPTIRRAPTWGRPAKALIDRVKATPAKLQAENPDAPIPVDLVTTSASGLDPDITPAAAAFQVPRVAKARDLPRGRVRALVDELHRGPLARYPRRAACQRAEAQPALWTPAAAIAPGP